MSPKNVKILLYRLERHTRHMEKGDVVFWDCPDGVTYELDPKKAVPGQWLRVDDANGLPVMAFLKGDPNNSTWWRRDGRLAVSLHPLKDTWAATLLHDEDDSPWKQYFATDGGNTKTASGPIAEARRPAFVLQTEGVEGCPIHEAQRFRVMIVRPPDIQHP